MHPCQLTLTDFRSYTAARLDCTHKLVILTGENGAGKTNALEALSLFAPGRGLRAARLDDMMRHDATEGWGVSLTLADGRRFGTGLVPQAPGRRSVRINGEPATLADLPLHLGLLWLTPAQDRLFLDSASERRRFLDRLVLSTYPGHAAHVARYEHAQRERLRLLSEGGRTDPDWLTVLEARIAEHGVAAAAARLETVTALAPFAADVSRNGFPHALIRQEGEIEARLAAGQPALACEEWLKWELCATRALDSAKGRTTKGPGRCDLWVEHGLKGTPAAQCSTGEQKALLVGLVLAHAQRLIERDGAAPLVLLDEIAAHLDASRRAALFDCLHGLKLPCWMTGTDEALFAAFSGAEADFVTVRAGSFYPGRFS